MDAFDEALIEHAQGLYDAAKAHEYYLRTRKLKGRHKGSPTFTVRTGAGEVQLSQQQLVEQKAYAAKRIAAIKQRLTELSAELRKAMSKAKSEKAKSHRQASKPQTAAEKSKASRESKQYRQSHKQQLATKQKHREVKKTKKKADPVAEVEAKITLIRGRLIAAVSIQRALASATKSN